MPSHKVSFKPMEDHEETNKTKSPPASPNNGASGFLRRRKNSSSNSPKNNGGSPNMRIQEDDSKQQQQRPSWRKSSLRKNSNKKGNNRSSMDNSKGNPEDIIVEEDDPVMELFKSRNTQKVRFALGENDATPKERGVNSGLKRQNSGTRLSTSANERLSSAFNIKNFMKGALFGTVKNKADDDAAFDLELQKEMEAAPSEIVWSTQEEGVPEVLRTHSGTEISGDAADMALDESFFSFTEDRETRAAVIKLLNKARRAHFLHFRYPYAIKCYVKALELLAAANYPDDHPTVVKTMQSLSAAHFANSAYRNSANIVKLGIKYEDHGELVRALKMYTIAYRIRRDNLSRSHPSLVVLLNMLGSIQIKRGELDEAMAIYELALKDSEPAVMAYKNNVNESSGEDSNASEPPLTPASFLTRSVTYREMGTIHEKWGETEQALRMYHKSLDCMAEYKGLAYKQEQEEFFDEEAVEEEQGGGEHDEAEEKALLLPSSSSSSPTAKRDKHQHDPPEETSRLSANNDDELLNCSKGESMELMFDTRTKSSRKKGNSIGTLDTSQTKSRYDVFFPLSLETKKKKKRLGKKVDDTEKKGDYTDVDVALTIHQIAQLHRSQQEYHLALPAFNVSLRGMKYALGKSHPNVAAILGNIGNLQKEMGDMDGAYSTYQQVLAIESYRLGLSHPDVVVTLHNIATIDAARGNHDHALSLYTQVVGLQRKLFGEDHESVAVTSACMGDVYERLGDTESAVECYEEALRIKIAALGRHSLEVARLLHKLGKLAVKSNDYHLAQSYISKAALVYKLNKLTPDNEWVVDVNRDAADVDAAIAMGRAATYEC